jgi:hypothetical protein
MTLGELQAMLDHTYGCGAELHLTCVPLRRWGGGAGFSTIQGNPGELP